MLEIAGRAVPVELGDALVALAAALRLAVGGGTHALCVPHPRLALVLDGAGHLWLRDIFAGAQAIVVAPGAPGARAALGHVDGAVRAVGFAWALLSAAPWRRPPALESRAAASRRGRRRQRNLTVQQRAPPRVYKSSVTTRPLIRCCCQLSAPVPSSSWRAPPSRPPSPDNSPTLPTPCPRSSLTNSPALERAARART
jgi:hypothetical protein